MIIGQNLVDEIVQRILTATKPQRVILFGSAATGGMTPDSDIDVLILKAPAADPDGEWLAVRRALDDLDYPFDLVFMTPDWFERHKDVFGGLAWPAHHAGRVIYDAA